MATFGKTDIGGTEANTSASCKIMGSGPFNLPADGNISKVSFYGRSVTASQKLRANFYADVAGSPSGSPLGESAEIDLTTVEGWHHLTYSPVLRLVAGDYWIFWLMEGTQQLRWFRDAAVKQWAYQVATYPNFPDPIVPNLVDDFIMSIYATYSPLGGGSVSNVSLIALGLGAWLAIQKKKKRMKKSVLAKKIARDAMKPMVRYLKKVDDAIKKAV